MLDSSAEQVAFEAIGTHWVIDIYSVPTGVVIDTVSEAITTRIEEFDACYSRFRNDSLIAKMSLEAGTYELPADAYPLCKLYQDLYQCTDGAFTPLIGSVLEEAGYDAQYSLQEKPTKTPTEKWEDILELHPRTLTLRKPALLDFGAAGKGYLVDIIAEILESFAIEKYCVDAGGDMVFCTPGTDALKVGLENPFVEGQVIGTIELCNSSICSSAGNRRKWGQYHHIIDPYTQKSPVKISATWVVAQNARVADALATALFLAPVEKLQPYFSFEYLMLYDDYSIQKSAGFSGKLFAAERTL